VSETYTAVDTRSGEGISGGIGRSGTGEPWVTFYVEVDDLQAVLDKAESLGAKTVVPVTEIPQSVTFAMFSDPDGLLIGLTKPAQGDSSGPDPSEGTGAPVDWFEVLGSDAERTQSFYRELFGWTIDVSGAENYCLVDVGSGHGIPGGLGSAEPGMRWAIVYASVDDVEKYLAQAERLGGQRLYGPIDVDDHMQSGALRDPAGNVFGVYHHEPH
jgi:predicted enzyme related to lactoylglutathione lyase